MTNTKGRDLMSGIWVMEYDNFGGPVRAVVVAYSQNQAMKIAGVMGWCCNLLYEPIRIGTPDDPTPRELAHEQP